MRMLVVCVALVGYFNVNGWRAVASIHFIEPGGWRAHIVKHGPGWGCVVLGKYTNSTR